MRWIDAVTARPRSLAYWARICFGVAVLATACHALASIALPFGWDHGIMASVGSSYVDGGLPYVDSWDMKGPVSYLPYAVAELLFGRTMWGVRIFDLVIIGAGCFAFYRLVAALTDRATGIGAGFAFYFWIAAGGWFFTATPEVWATVITIIAFAPILAGRGAPSLRRVILAGLLVGCVGLVKPVYWSFGIVPLLAIALTPGLALTRRTSLTIATGLSAALPVALTIAYFALRGGFWQALEVHLLYSLKSYGALDTGTNPLIGFAAFFSRPTIALMLPFLALGAWNLRGRPAVLWPIAGWITANFLAVILQGKFYYYHWVPLYPALLLLAVIGVAGLLRDQSEKRTSGFIAVAASLAFFAQVCALPFYDVAKAGYYLGLKRAPDLYYNSYSFLPGGITEEQNYNAADELAAARYIAASSAPDEGLFVWGNNATLAYLADRPNPTRFTFEMPLSLDGPYRPGYRAEAMAGLTADPPAFVVVGINWRTSEPRADTLEAFPQFAAFLEANYSFDRSFGAIDIYRRNSR